MNFQTFKLIPPFRAKGEVSQYPGLDTLARDSLYWSRELPPKLQDHKDAAVWKNAWPRDIHRLLQFVEQMIASSRLAETSKPAAERLHPLQDGRLLINEYEGIEMPPFVAPSGRPYGERELLACLALAQCATTALHFLQKDIEAVGWLMADISDLMIECEGLAEVDAIEAEGGIVSDVARRNALRRHAENHAMRDDALKHFEDHAAEFRSLNAAAEAIAGKIVPVKFRTVRQWLTDHRKPRP